MFLNIRRIMNMDAFQKSSEEINKVKNNGGRIIAIGTTVLRLLESSKDSKGDISPYKGETNIFIKPGWEIILLMDHINFHTPKSTLLLLITYWKKKQ